MGKKDVIFTGILNWLVSSRRDRTSASYAVGSWFEYDQGQCNQDIYNVVSDYTIELKVRQKNVSESDAVVLSIHTALVESTAFGTYCMVFFKY